MRDLNECRYIQIGLKIAYYRKLRGLTQEQLAEKIDRSPGYISQIETPGFVQPVSLATLFAVADTLHVAPSKFLEFDD
ncbi:MAG: helix-turn-helix domain-containing protein [Treponema sp.]|jgi:transcriptional regulator with XRE-family HTH domain|nr:helix-turn-helix domain-containing protein [Treponema sp.]